MQEEWTVPIMRSRDAASFFIVASALSTYLGYCLLNGWLGKRSEDYKWEVSLTFPAWEWWPHFHSVPIGWISAMSFRRGRACGLAKKREQT